MFFITVLSKVCSTSTYTATCGDDATCIGESLTGSITVPGVCYRPVSELISLTCPIGTFKVTLMSTYMSTITNIATGAVSYYTYFPTLNILCSNNAFNTLTSNIGMIVGIVVGVAVFLTIVPILICCCCGCCCFAGRKKRGNNINVVSPGMATYH